MRKNLTKKTSVGQLFFSGTLIVSLLFPYGVVIAQTSPLQRFDPSATVNTSSNGRTFEGLSFSGVGGAVAGCTNIGGTLSGGIGSLTSIFKNEKPTTQNTPLPQTVNQQTVNDIRTQSGTTQADLDALNRTRDLSKPAAISTTQSPLEAIKTDSTAQQVPVVAKKTDEELKKANQRENCLNGVAYAVAKSLLQQITEKTVNWVNTGFNGNPLYVRDLDSFLKSVSDQQISLFLDRIPSQDPIFGYSIRSIVSENLTGVSDGLIGATMDTPEARAYQAFQDDFKNGGWKAFINPANNPIGAIFNAADELSTSVTSQQENVKTQLQNGNGFLDLQRCVEYADNGLTKYPYSYNGYSCQQDIKKSIASAYATCMSQRGSGAEASCKAESNQQFNPALLTTCIKTLQVTAQQNSDKQCLRYETVTPGSIIQAQVSEVTTSPVRQLEQADQINEVLGAFFDQLLNKLLSEGLSSLRGRSSLDYNFSGAGLNVVIGTSGNILSNTQSGTSALGYVQSGSGYAGDFDVSRPQHVRAALQTQYDYLSTLLDARVSLNKIVPTVGALDYCIPGPNPTWQEGLSASASSFVGSLQEITKEQTNAGSTVGSTAGAIAGSFIPGVGTVIGGLVGGLIGGLFNGGKSHAIMSTGLTFFDKATETDLPARTIIFRASGHSIPFITDTTKLRLENLIKTYQQEFTFEKIRDAFLVVDPGNSAYVNGFLTSAYEETAQLPQYAAAALEIDTYYETSENDSREAIATLESIYSEVNDIVATAKARYIAEQAASGTPVNLSCINDAYVINTTAITPRPREESSAPSPLFDQFIEANNYFYQSLYN